MRYINTNFTLIITSGMLSIQYNKYVNMETGLLMNANFYAYYLTIVVNKHTSSFGIITFD